MKRGSHMTDEQKAHLSAMKKGKPGHPVSPETRARMSVAQMGHPGWNKGILGHPVLPEQRAKTSATLMGHPVSLEARAKMSGAAKETWACPEFKAKMSAMRWKCGKVVSNRRHTAHRNLLGFVPLNAWFLGCEAHHVDKEQIIYIPGELHHAIYHRQDTGQGMAQINAIAYNFLFKQEVEAVIVGKE